MALCGVRNVRDIDPRVIAQAWRCQRRQQDPAHGPAPGRL